MDLPFLADTFDLTGAAIRGIVLTAAFMAAAEGVCLGMQELIGALVMEYAKIDKVLTAQDLGEYSDLI